MATAELVTTEQVEDVLLHGGDLGVISPDEVQEDMVRRILQAGTIGEAFDGFKATPVAELEGKLVRIDGVAWMRSAFTEGPKVYALLQLVDLDTGEQLTASMGGRSLMASFLWAQRNEAMPFEGVFRRERSNSSPDRAFWTFKLA